MVASSKIKLYSFQSEEKYFYFMTGIHRMILFSKYDVWIYVRMRGYVAMYACV